MTNCKVCGKPTGREWGICSECAAKERAERLAEPAPMPYDPSSIPTPKPFPRPEPSPAERDRAREDLCKVLGVGFFGVGLWFLVVQPSQGESIVNLQRLTIGETASIIGAIFLAAAIRPRG